MSEQQSANNPNSQPDHQRSDSDDNKLLGELVVQMNLCKAAYLRAKKNVFDFARTLDIDELETIDAPSIDDDLIEHLASSGTLSTNFDQQIEHAMMDMPVRTPDYLQNQVNENAKLREKFLKHYECMRSREVHSLSGSIAKNIASYASGLRKANRIFGFEHEMTTLFPVFQFDEKGKPRKVIRQVIELLGEDMSGWSLAIWFTTKNKKLGGRKPVELLGKADEAVVMAANALVEDNLY